MSCVHHEMKHNSYLQTVPLMEVRYSHTEKVSATPRALLYDCCYTRRSSKTFAGLVRSTMLQLLLRRTVLRHFAIESLDMSIEAYDLRRSFYP